MGLILALVVLGFFVYKALNQSSAEVYWFLLILGVVAAVYVFALFSEGVWLG